MINSVKITGDKTIDRILSNLPDAVQKKVMLSAFRKAGRPMVNEMKRMSPVSDEPHVSGGVLRMPGNLKKSHGIVNGKSKRYPTVYIGPRYGKKYKSDGFYFKFIIEGSDSLAKHIKNPTQNWIQNAGRKTQSQVESTIRLEIGRSLEREMKRSGAL